MKVTVTKYLNVRVGKPSVNAPTYQYLAPGSELEVEDQPYKGDPYDKNDNWLKDAANNYYWSGGIEAPARNLISVRDTKSTIVNVLSDLPACLVLNNGCTLTSQGINGIVAVLDSGVTNTSLASKIIQEYDFVNKVPKAADVYGHGTKVAGIICGDNPIIKSISSKCSIMNYRVADQDGIVTSDPVYFALLELDKLTSPIDVINLSFDVPLSLLPHIQPIIDRLLNKGAVTVVAAGNGNSLTTMADLKNVIKVGAIPEKDFATIKKIGLNNKYHCAFIDRPITSTDRRNGSDEISQTSAYAALVSSMVCSHLKSASSIGSTGIGRLATVINLIKQCSFPLLQQQFPENFKPLMP